MIITKEHLDFYRVKKCNPAFARGLNNGVPSIHSLINSQEGKKRPKNFDLHNAISLLILVRSNQQHQLRWLHENEPKTLREYMETCDCQKRARFFKRWLRRMNRPTTNKKGQ